jgi:DNA topoisomerase-1
LTNPEKTKNKKQKTNIKRITFHEITKEAVEEALEHAREIDLDLVDAQQGRRVLDRVVGYTLSPVLWKKVRRGLSAGRVQSVAVRLIVEREKEIEAFASEKFYRVTAIFKHEGQEFAAELVKLDGKSISRTNKLKLFDGDYTYSQTIFSGEQARQTVDEFVVSLSKLFKVVSVKGAEIHRLPLPPFTTSKLQQMASRRFGWSGKQTMSVAQHLYEKGLITYHRTDSVSLSAKAVGEFRKFIGKTYGADYLSEKERHFKNTSKNAKRPTKLSDRLR